MMLRIGLIAAVLEWSAAAAPAGLEIDPSRSFIVAVVHKTGLLSVAGHEHGVLAKDWTAVACFDGANPEAARVTVTIPTAKLVIDSAEARRLAGVPPAGPSAKDVQEIQAKMLDAPNLAAAQYPEIRYASTAARRRGAGALILDGSFTLRGRTRDVSSPLKIEMAGETLHISGAFTVKQTDFGITPVSIGELVKVKDSVDVRFEIYGRPAGPCQ